MRAQATRCMALLVLALAESECGQNSTSCPMVEEPPPAVIVVDTANGENVCDAQVTASSGSSTLELIDEAAQDASLSDA